LAILIAHAIKPVLLFSSNFVIVAKCKQIKSQRVPIMTARSINKPSTPHAELYEKDYLLWLEQVVQLLQEDNFASLDIPNLIDEIEDMGKSQKQSVESNLEIILMHLLKYKHQPQMRSNSWRYSILEHRNRLHKSFKASPSLKRYYLEVFPECYGTARKLAATETGLAIANFPTESSFTPEQVLNEDYLPE
jgi:Domain of unknown function DUF29